MSTHITDTHALVFFLLDPGKLGRKAESVFESPHARICVPSVALLEIQYLVEIGRIKTSMSEVMAFIETSGSFHIHPFDSPALHHSLDIKGQRDPFDRIILATALSLKLPLITKDRWMRSMYRQCVW